MCMRSFRSRFFLHSLMVLFLVFSGVPVSGQRMPAGRARSVTDFPENLFVRNLLLDEVLGPIEDAAALSPDVLKEPGYPYQVQFFIEETKEYYYFCFYHGKEINFASPVKGSLFFQRSREDGGLVKMKVFYKNDPGSYFSIEPVHTGMSRMNIFLLGRNIQQDININESLQRIARMSVREIMTITKGYVNWSFYLPGGEFPPPVLTSTDDLTDRIRPYLRQLGDEEDGAIDENGRYVYIRDGSLQGDGTEGGLNCSGFAKWVVDGILYPKTGSLLSIDALKIRHPDSRGNRWSKKTEDQEEPYFGLDWTRNLALQAFRVFLPEELPRGSGTSVIEAADVNYLRYHE